MARVEAVKETVGCRLLLLLFWAVLVCSILYMARDNNASDVSVQHFLRVPFSRIKRHTSNIPQPHVNSCGQIQPTQEDFKTLTKLVNGRNGRARNPMVHCSIVNSCSNGKFMADCYSNVCNSYHVLEKQGGHAVSSLSAEGLSDLIEGSLHEHSFMTVDDLNQHIDVHCEDRPGLRLEITGDIVPSPRCEVTKTQVLGNSRHGRKPPIHVLYFRFLSQWEMPVRFPGVLSLLDSSAYAERVRVLNLDTHQATRWADDELLSVLLQGRVGPFTAGDSLLDTLQKEGYCFTLQDLSCSRSRQQESMVMNITSLVEEIACGGDPLRHRGPAMDKICTEVNLTDSETRSVLTSLLLKADRGTGKENPVFSVNIINVKDFKHAGALDMALKNFFLHVLTERDGVVMMVGGVGNPALLNFDLSVHLQLQASRPAFMLCSIGNSSSMNSREIKWLDRSLFTLKNVHHFIKQVVMNGPRLEQSVNELITAYHTEDSKTCEGLGVNPPFMCLCEEGFVQYENDSLMAGFAELTVGLINAQLPKSSPTARARGGDSHSSCAKVTGTVFSNVRVGRYRHKLPQHV